MTPTRRRALDAAIDLLATQGLRALTHARVDERAGLAKGSTSNYFRTRQALVNGVVARLEELDLTQVDLAFAPTTAHKLVDTLCQAFEHMTGPGRAATAARLALFLEAGHTPELREALSRGREAMMAVGVVALARLGARDPQGAATALGACFEGHLLHSVARHDPTDPRPTFELLVKAALP